MFSWSFDAETGGILLLDRRDTRAHSELSPAYALEFREAGVQEAARAGNDDRAPVAWHCRGAYYYRGEKFARRVEDKIEIIKSPVRRGETMQLIDVNAMTRKNSAILEAIETASAETLRDAMRRDGVTSFNVAYSAGKDSEALLVFCMRNFPEAIRKAVFADTTMELHETLRRVDDAKKELEAWGIPLETRTPYIDGLTGWRLFGVPSRRCRWCCQACKSGALAKLGEGEAPYVMGARALESRIRSGYGVEAGAKSLSAAPTYRPLFDWSGAEVWAYLYAHGASINNAYKHGHHRACCVVCPYSSPFEVAISARMEPEITAEFKAEYLHQFPGHDDQFNRRYLGDDGTWGRSNSKALTGEFPVTQKIENGIYKYILNSSRYNSDWLNLAKKRYDIRVYDKLEKNKYAYIIQYFTRNNTAENKVLKYILNRAFYCVACGYCVNYCRKKAIRIDGGRLFITSDCDACLECVSLECIRAKALRGFDGLGREVSEKKIKKK